jgi:hypothetical protein
MSPASTNPILLRAPWFAAPIVLLACRGPGTVHTTEADHGRAGAYEAPANFVVTIPEGYRDWRVVSVAREEGDLDDIRVVLGNDIAMQTYRAGGTSFPDGAILARLAWQLTPDEENDRAFGRRQSSVAGLPKNGVQFMVKDAKKYASTGGWGYGHFDDGRPAQPAVMRTCFACHQAIAHTRDQVFTRYAP